MKYVTLNARYTLKWQVNQFCRVHKGLREFPSMLVPESSAWNSEKKKKTQKTVKTMMIKIKSFYYHLKPLK